MLVEERFNAILSLMNSKHCVTVAELTAMLNISESTVRRDLTTLDEMGKLKKVHGGAVLGNENSSKEYKPCAKELQNIEKKEPIARYAATLIHDDDCVFIDAGTTTRKMLDYIDETHAVFVTNGLVHAQKLLQRGFKVYMLGGEMKPSSQAAVGAEAIVNLKKYNFTKCFMGTNGISIDNGFTVSDMEEALVKSEAISSAYVTFVLADSSKFEVVSSVTFAPINHACIITDHLPNPVYHDTAIVKEVLK